MNALRRLGKVTMLLRALALSASAAALLAVETAMGGSAAIAAANLTIQTATIQSGRLIITGTAAAAGTVVKIHGTAFPVGRQLAKAVRL